MLLYLEKVVFFEIPHDRGRPVAPEIVHDTVQSQKPKDHNQTCEFCLVSHSDKQHQRDADQIYNQVFQRHGEVK